MSIDAIPSPQMPNGDRPLRGGPPLSVEALQLDLFNYEADLAMYVRLLSAIGSLSNGDAGARVNAEMHSISWSTPNGSRITFGVPENPMAEGSGDLTLLIERPSRDVTRRLVAAGLALWRRPQRVDAVIHPVTVATNPNGTHREVTGIVTTKDGKQKPFTMGYGALQFLLQAA